MYAYHIHVDDFEAALKGGVWPVARGEKWWVWPRKTDVVIRNAGGRWRVHKHPWREPVRWPANDVPHVVWTALVLLFFVGGQFHLFQMPVWIDWWVLIGVMPIVLPGIVRASTIWSRARRAKVVVLGLMGGRQVLILTNSSTLTAKPEEPGERSPDSHC